jgi:hypothetical protein
MTTGTSWLTNVFVMRTLGMQILGMSFGLMDTHLRMVNVFVIKMDTHWRMVNVFGVILDVMTTSHLVGFLENHTVEQS